MLLKRHDDQTVPVAFSIEASIISARVQLYISWQLLKRLHHHIEINCYLSNSYANYRATTVKHICAI